MDALIQSLRIILLSIAAAIVYGILHDQITARVCVEYFTIGHPQLFKIPTENPTLLAFGWGIVATWWVGLPLGIMLSIAAQAGSRPKRSTWSLVVPICKLLTIMAICALFAAVVGWLLARAELVVLVGPLAKLVPPEKHAAFLADLWAHNASYLVGIVGGIVLAVKTWRLRGKQTETAG
jgi:hypothetical protein